MRLKILMFGWEFPPYNSGGLGVACMGLTKALVAGQGVDITFVLPKRVDIKDKYMKFAFADVKINFRPIDTLLSPYVSSASYLEKLVGKTAGVYGANLFAEVSRYAELAEDIALSEDFDVIHAHDWLAFGAGMVAKRASGKPLVLHIHATEFDRTGGLGANELIYNIERSGMEMADSVISVSQLTKDMVVKHYGIDPQKVEVVHNGIDYEEGKTDSIFYTEDGLTHLKKAGNKLVLFLGRLTIQKGVDKLLEAAKKVLEYEPNTIFMLVGSGDMQNQLIGQAAALGISDKVIFPGFLRGSEVDSVYSQADLFVMPSVSEPFGLVALESAIKGTPVIVSKQSGVSEVMNHALKVDFWDIDEMANQIISVLKYGSLKRDLAENGKVEAKKASWHRAAAKVAKVYRRLASNSLVNVAGS